MATNSENTPARRLDDLHPDAAIDWSKPGAPAVPQSSTAGAARQGRNTRNDGWMIEGSLIYRLNAGANCDEINVTMVNGSRDLAERYNAAVELLASLREADAAAPAPGNTAQPADKEE